MSSDAEPFAEIREEGFGVAAAVMQMTRTGTPQQVARVKEILAETARACTGCWLGTTPA